MAEVARKLAHLELPCVDDDARPLFLGTFMIMYAAWKIW